MGGYTRERKYVGPLTSFNRCLDLLQHHCVPDPSHPVGTIESIYFDDYRHAAYWEKADGCGLKRKHRIRWYPGTGHLADTDIRAFLEIKHRIGGVRDKERLVFAADRKLLEESGLHNPSIQSLLYDHASAAGIRLPGDLVPTVSIRYRRHRFLCPCTGSRIGLDTRMHAGRINGDLFHHDGPLTHAMAVCEIKAPPHIEWPGAGSLFQAGFRLSSFSKYGVFMHAILNGGLSA